jgi:hypothetical protein
MAQVDPAAPRRFEILLFALAWLSFAYFHQGGGWNQNGRFALTRALVESGHPWIDDFLVYVPREGSARPASRACRCGRASSSDGRELALGWYAGDGPLVPLAPECTRRGPPGQRRCARSDGGPRRARARPSQYRHPGPRWRRSRAMRWSGRSNAP